MLFILIIIIIAIILGYLMAKLHEGDDPFLF
jgi:hypothetical protein